MENKIFLTVQEIMKLLGISRPTVYKMIKSKKWDIINTGRKYLISTESIKLKTPQKEGENKKGVKM